MNYIRCIILGATLFAPSVAFAQACVGVEARVNLQTTSLTTAVSATIAAGTTTYTAQQLLERQLILSSLRVLAEQNEVSLEQKVTATEAAANALGQTILADSTSAAVANAAQDFGHTGHNACDLVVQGVSFRTAVDDAKATSDTLHDTVLDGYLVQTVEEHNVAMEDWSSLAQTATDVSATDVLDGDEAKSLQFARLVLGPPSPPVGGGGAASGLENIIRMQDAARRSVVAKVIADIASDQAITEQMENITDVWIGDDGGEEWSATLAAAPGRAALLDLARIEAANITASALEVRKSVREEFALSTFALSYTDRRLNDWQGLGGNN